MVQTASSSRKLTFFVMSRTLFVSLRGESI